MSKNIDSIHFQQTKPKQMKLILHDSNEIAMLIAGSGAILWIE